MTIFILNVFASSYIIFHSASLCLSLLSFYICPMRLVNPCLIHHIMWAIFCVTTKPFFRYLSYVLKPLPFFPLSFSSPLEPPYPPYTDTPYTLSLPLSLPCNPLALSGTLWHSTFLVPAPTRCFTSSRPAGNDT